MAKSLKGSLSRKIEPLLRSVERPSRYLGGEWNAPEIAEGGTRVVLSYPDVYEIGMSNLGLAILQEVVNDMPGAVAERAYSPWVDMEREMRAAGVPLFSLETHRPVSESDIFGISIPHELTYSNVINLIDMAGLPLNSRERHGLPILIGGGCGTANPEPLAPFFDLFVLGEGEETLGRLVELVSRSKADSWSRQRLLGEAARIPGVYKPDDYEVEYGSNGAVSRIERLGGAPERVRKNTVDVDLWTYPRKPIVPFCEAVHDRLNVELFRGCTRGCRFCQAGMICRPVRERSPEEVVEMAGSMAGQTGHDEISLCSLSSSDYTAVESVAKKIEDICEESHMTLTLPSLRMDGYSVNLVSGLNRGGLTFAPEAGTERLRRVINKPISERDITDAVVKAVRAGRRRIKLYFMIGLPTETMEDVQSISDLVFRIRDTVRNEGLASPLLNVSVSTFVPKPHTPFQWAAQERIDSVESKQAVLRKGLRARGVNLSWHDREMSLVEGLVARGDRRLASVLEGVWRKGARFESWSENFDMSKWNEAVSENGIDPDFYLYRQRGEKEIFPWDHLDFGVESEFLYREYEHSLSGELTSDCRTGKCHRCGACSSEEGDLVLAGSWK